MSLAARKVQRPLAVLAAPLAALAALAALAIVAAVSLTGCATPAPTTHGTTQEAPLSLAHVAQSDVNRMASLAMRDNLQSLLRIADKLYQRNPTEWRKTSAVSREDALAQIKSAIDSQTPWPGLRERSDIGALSLALSQKFTGDRVAAFVTASADMLIKAHGNRTTFYLIHSLDAQYLHNAARNFEIAVALLGNRRTASGQPLLLSDNAPGVQRKLRFDRDFGTIIGRLDLLAEMVNEKYRRALISYVQNTIGGTFFQLLPVDALPAQFLPVN